FYGGSLDVAGTPASLPAGATTFFGVRVQNLSNFVWSPGVNLSYHWYDAGGNTVVWDGLRTSLAGLAIGDVRPVTVNVAVPTAPGAYTLRFDVVQEGVAWFGSQGMQTPSRAVSVLVGRYAAAYAPSVLAVAAAPGSMTSVPVKVTNLGTLVWQPGRV